MRRAIIIALFLLVVTSRGAAAEDTKVDQYICSEGYCVWVKSICIGGMLFIITNRGGIVQVMDSSLAGPGSPVTCK